MTYAKIDYELVCKKVYEIYIDYGLTTFPIDVISLAKKMGFKLIPYSDFSEDDREVLTRLEPDGFRRIENKNGFPEATIYYNDFSSPNRVKSTIGHEIKHIVFGDTDDCTTKDEDLANYFAKTLMAPIPYMVYAGITDYFEIMSFFKISREMAEYVALTLRNRFISYGDVIFDSEKEFIRLFTNKYT